ncbi:MAG: tetratricopeptide repeat protein [Gammaproteobacteria bacterium]|nr:tetratricopeptide repeat protein [Gammaproteobacteria bacterium]
MTARLAAAVAVMLSLSACATAPFGTATNAPATTPRGNESGAGPDVSRQDPAGDIAAPSPRSSAATALLEQSRSDRNNGDLNAAAATIERALSIAPDDPLLWIELGEIRVAQGDRAGGEEMGRKALTLTGSDTALAARARALLR